MSLIIPSILNSLCFSSPKNICRNFEKISSGKDIAYFKDNGSSILAVAHLDTVNKPGLNYSAKAKLDAELYFNPYLDDRLGVYTILHLLPSLGINMDFLFTLGEETGNSTARIFKPNKKYNWIVEFDRRGEDVVDYSFCDLDLEARLKEAGFCMGFGSFSDICLMEGGGCKAFNVGIGYFNEHSTRP